MNSEVLNALVSRFETLESDLTKLDAATGDGDHGTTILKGMRAAADSPEQAVKAFRRAAGGASGSLFACVLAAVDEAQSGASSWPDALARAADKIAMLGQAVTGDKTMLDALQPAAAAATLERAAMAAREGCNNTQAMAAKRGRAKNVEGAGVGHIDAGATSVAEILEVLFRHSQLTEQATGGMP